MQREMGQSTQKVDCNRHFLLIENAFDNLIYLIPKGSAYSVH